ncbi:segregation and condensation protein [Lactobacillus pasteurii DSM 23907 = CRBIP 24.76]|uniref:Segregation and condensation protein A n=1 Tax=Lactobacillus pasteurii DSM 23907 = CRBIP 24.76 TaxID=1423790 RepID=I7LE01_9LACO|nr:segregation/condensation protein A [Lactobacillus pasteurii]KRK08622.1 segregation and condensation protein [Lactobacillus pasteurii DSM 23907 = CRBIP 24.76]TDG76555.1 hypothetical protein C5L33_001314 [Lactobacillus pasteurii]CCI85353.1 Segregation and condensation protein A [Lactobacillus pasteurii DSM 23907 = CRBIP 24.76]
MDNQDLTVELPNFEGPLDLLLHLIRSQKIDIYDIPIAKITHQYLAYIQRMKELNLQLAGEYFVMSSTLLRIKSQYLLPKNDFVSEEEYSEDPREELVEQLIQYSVFKNIANYFKNRQDELPLTASKEPSSLDSDRIAPLPRGQINAEDLALAFSEILKKASFKQEAVAEVEIKTRSVDEMMLLLKRKLKTEKSVSFFKCIKSLTNISEAIGLFLAMLELCKNQEIKASQSHDFRDIKLESC